MKPHSRSTMIPTNFLSSIPSASSVGNLPVSLPFPPRQRRAFHNAVLDEILQDRLPSRRHRRNKRCVKRKMSNFPLRQRTDKPLPLIFAIINKSSPRSTVSFIQLQAVFTYKIASSKQA